MLRLAGEGSPYGYSEYDGSPGGAAGPSGSQPMQPQQQLPYQQDQFPHLGELPGAMPACSSCLPTAGAGASPAHPPLPGAVLPGALSLAQLPLPHAQLPGMLPASVASSSLTGSSLAGSVHASPPQPALPPPGGLQPPPPLGAGMPWSDAGLLHSLAQQQQQQNQQAGLAQWAAQQAQQQQQLPNGAQWAPLPPSSDGRGSLGDPATDAELAMLPLPGHLPSSSFAPPAAVGAYSSPGRTSLDSARSLSPRSVQSSATPSVLSPSLIPIGATASTAAACSPFALPPALPDGAAPQHHYRSSPTLPPPSLSESSVGPPSSAHACTPRLAPTGGPPLALWAGGSRSDDSGALATGAEPFLDAAVAENSRRASRDLQMQFDACGGGGGSGAGGSAPMVAAALQTNNTHVRESIANQLSLLLDDDDDDDDGLGGAPGATKVRAISEELAELCVSPSRGHAAEVCREVTGANVNVMPSPGRAPAC